MTAEEIRKAIDAIRDEGIEQERLYIIDYLETLACVVEWCDMPTCKSESLQQFGYADAQYDVKRIINDSQP